MAAVATVPGRYRAERRSRDGLERVPSFGPTRRRPCPLCGRDTPEPIFAEYATSIERVWVSDDLFEVALCRTCGMTYTVEVPTDDWFARYHSPEHNPELRASGRSAIDTAEHSHRISRPFYDRGLQILERSGLAGSRLLDIGCSEGYFVELARERGFRAIGIDPVPSAVEAGRARGLPLHTGSAGDAPVEPGSVDVATMWDTIEHFADPGAVLRATHRLLRPGGLLLLSTPNFTVDIARIRKRADLRAPDVYEYWRGSLHAWDHINFWTPPTLDRHLRDCGFEPERSRRPFFRGTSNRGRAAGLYRYAVFALSGGRVDLTFPQFVVASSDSPQTLSE
jgi:2-polyprenyl-3-methyl-5-hydroxy-6-metoxy-1,4-benzoquinol methylase